MPTHLGATEIDDIYLGSTQIDSVYLGTEEVYAFGVPRTYSFTSGYSVDGNPDHAWATQSRFDYTTLKQPKGVRLTKITMPSNYTSNTHYFDASVDGSTWVRLATSSSGSRINKTITDRTRYKYFRFGCNSYSYTIWDEGAGLWYYMQDSVTINYLGK